MMAPLSQDDRTALELLVRIEQDTPGMIVNDEIMWAHFFYLCLVFRGFATSAIGADGPTYTINEAGRAALVAPLVH